MAEDPGEGAAGTPAGSDTPVSAMDTPVPPSELPPGRTWDVATLLHIQQIVRRINAGLSLQGTLQAVVDGVMEVAEFEVVVLHHLQADGMLTCVAVAGDEAAREELLGRRTLVAEFEQEFALADQWGTLRFVPHERLPTGVEPTGWIPDFETVDEPDAWHPLDALFAPLHSPQGLLIGLLSVDLPRNRRRPEQFQREVLDIYAAHAGLAIHHASMADQLTAGEQAFRLAFEAAGTGMAVIRLGRVGGHFSHVNRAFCELLGYSEEELLNRTITEITHPDDRAADNEYARQAAAGQRIFHIEKRYLHATSGSVWVAMTTSLVEDASGVPSFAISQIEDVSARRALREELTRHASRDALTGVANRRALYEHLDSVIADSGEADDAITVLFCDLDGFKSVNDHFGHVVGDEVLNVVAQRLRAAVRGSDLIARLGGDEFVFVTTARAAVELAARLTAVVATPIQVQSHVFRLTASIGLADLRGRQIESRQLIHEADVAMYHAKRSGGNAWVGYTDALEAASGASSDD